MEVIAHLDDLSKLRQNNHLDFVLHTNLTDKVTFIYFRNWETREQMRPILLGLPVIEDIEYQGFLGIRVARSILMVKRHFATIPALTEAK